MESESCKLKNSKCDTRQTVAVVFVSFAMMSYGFIGVWSSPALHDFLSNNPPVMLTSSQLSWIISASSLGSMFGPVLAAFLMDRVGRRNSLHLLNILPATSWIITFFATSFPALFIARCLGGTWGGIATTVVTVYISEIVHPDIRSSINTLSMFFAKVGALAMFILGNFATYWTLSIVGLIISFFVWFALLFIPESPYYYAIKKLKTHALKSLTWLQGDEKSQDEFIKIEKFVETELKKKDNIINIFSNLDDCKVFIVVVVLTVLSTASGGILVAVLTIVIPKKAFFSLTNQDCVIIVGIIAVLFSYRPNCLSKFGNKSLLILSGLICGICMALIALWYYLESSVLFVSTTLYWVPFVSYSIFCVFFGLFIHPILMTLKGEMFSVKLKSSLSSIVTVSSEVSAFIILKSFIPIEHHFGNHYNFIIASVSCLLLVVITHFFLTETEGKSLEDIQIEISNSRNSNQIPN